MKLSHPPKRRYPVGGSIEGWYPDHPSKYPAPEPKVQFCQRLPYDPFNPMACGAVSRTAMSPSHPMLHL